MKKWLVRALALSIGTAAVALTQAGGSGGTVYAVGSCPGIFAPAVADLSPETDRNQNGIICVRNTHPSPDPRTIFIDDIPELGGPGD